MLAESIFVDVVKHAPLVSIDLVVLDDAGKVLVGQRVNEPAKGTWFVPGGRIAKGEDLDQAFTRVATSELGPGDWRRSRSRLLGAFTHVYPTNFASIPGVSTHYVVLAHVLNIDHPLELPADQHSEYRWVRRSDPAPDGGIHPYTAVYLDQLSA